MKRILLSILVTIFPTLVFAQGAVLQGGPTVPGHLPQYVFTGNSQAIVIDGGGAVGGSVGVNPAEIGVTARGTGTAPYAGQGTGPYGTNICDYDAPTNNASGYHFFCLSANAQGGGLIAYGAGGTASQLPLIFNVNGTSYQFPFVSGGIVGPGTTVVNDAACWNNTIGTLLKDCGPFVTVGGNNTWTGTNNFTGTFQIGGITQTFPPSGNILGNSDVQTITNKHIGASQIDSGTLSAVVFPALTGDVTNAAGSLATTISAGVVTNAKLAPAASANTIKGAATSTAVTDLSVPSCSAANQALQWTTGVGLSCATVSASTAGWGLNLSGGVFSISTTQPPYGFEQAVNLGLSASAAGSNLTITLTGANGSNASATNPVSIPFRSGTLTNGNPVWGIVTSALNLVIPSGATLGTSSSNVPFRIWIFASYNGGTPQLGAAVCSSSTQIFPCSSWEYNRVTSTTISGLAASSGVLYATAGVSNDPVKIIGFCDYATGLATAGAWATACTTLQLFGPGIKKPGDIVQGPIYQQTGANTTTTNHWAGGNNLPTQATGASALSQMITPTSSPNMLRFRAGGQVASSTGTAGSVLYLTNNAGTAVATNGIGVFPGGSGGGYFGIEYVTNAATSSSQTWNLYFSCTVGTCGINWTGGGATFNGGGNTFLSVEEIMGSLEPSEIDHSTLELRMVG